jgi:hypothetical protein
VYLKIAKLTFYLPFSWDHEFAQINSSKIKDNSYSFPVQSAKAVHLIMPLSKIPCRQKSKILSKIRQELVQEAALCSPGIKSL